MALLGFVVPVVLFRVSKHLIRFEQSSLWSNFVARESRVRGTPSLLWNRQGMCSVGSFFSVGFLYKQIMKVNFIGCKILLSGQTDSLSNPLDNAARDVWLEYWRFESSTVRSQ